MVIQPANLKNRCNVALGPERPSPDIVGLGRFLMEEAYQAVSLDSAALHAEARQVISPGTSELLAVAELHRHHVASFYSTNDSADAIAAPLLQRAVAVTTDREKRSLTNSNLAAGMFGRLKAG